LNHIGKGNPFRNEIPVAQQLKGSINKWDCMKLKRYCTAKKTVTRMKKPTE
jgi:hypothetical protein